MTEPGRTPAPAMGHLAYLAVEAWGPPPGSSRWLDGPHDRLDGRRPWDVAQASLEGYERVVALLRAESPQPLPEHLVAFLERSPMADPADGPLDLSRPRDPGRSP